MLGGILLLGGLGQIGWELRRTLAPLGPIAAPDRSALDLGDLVAVRLWVREQRPALIVNAAAYTAVDAGARFLIFRTAWVYSTRRRNFLLTMRKLATERDELRVVSGQTGNPTWARAIAESTAAVLARCWQDSDVGPVPALEIGAVSGKYHTTSAGSTTWHGFACAIVEHACATVVVIFSIVVQGVTMRSVVRRYVRRVHKSL